MSMSGDEAYVLAMDYVDEALEGGGALKGDDGKSAYQSWLDLGNTGTEEDFINSLKGEKGDNGKSAYQYAKDGGYIGTETEFTTNIARSGVISKELEVERARIDNLTTLQDGSTTGDAELIDARIDKDGNTYVNVGEHIRTVSSQLSSEINDLSNGKINNELNYEWKKGAWLLEGTFMSNNETFISTNIENVTVGDTLSIEMIGTHQLRVVAFDDNGNFKKVYNESYFLENTSFVIEYPKIAFSFTIDASKPITIEESQYLKLTLEGDAPFMKKISNEIKEEFKDYTFVSFGDSIMSGDGNNGIGIVDMLIRDYGANGIDYAVGGSSMQKYDDKGHIPSQIENAINNGLTEPDIFLLNGLSNDVAYGDNLGTLTESFDYTTKGYTNFVDGLEYAIGLLKRNYPQTPIIYFIPHSTPSRVYDREKTFGDMARSVCNKWAIPVVDLYKDGNLNARLTEQKNLYCDNGGTHPNNEGYIKFYMPLIVAKIKELLN